MQTSNRVPERIPDESPHEPKRWETAWLDLAAFTAGLWLAWVLEWRAGDLVWCLWLSSLSVGFALILWAIFSPILPAWRHRSDIARKFAENPVLSSIGVLILCFGALFTLTFFTVHFGGFHFVHSVFLNGFFPVFPEHSTEFDIPGPGLYLEVLRRYGWFIPLAFIAERAAFLRVLERNRGLPGDTAVTVEAIARRKAANARGEGDPFFAPYKNVIRMHLLIFFFFGAVALELDHFAVYALVYALYFFPWRLLRKPSSRSSAGA